MWPKQRYTVTVIDRFRPPGDEDGIYRYGFDTLDEAVNHCVRAVESSFRQFCTPTGSVENAIEAWQGIGDHAMLWDRQIPGLMFDGEEHLKGVGERILDEVKSQASRTE